MSDPVKLPPDFEAKFGEMFGELFARAGKPTARDGLRVELTITVDEAATGVKKTVVIRRQQPCEPCAGVGSTTPGAVRTPCATCNGRGHHVQQQGFFAITAACTACKGTRGAFADPCTACEGAGTHAVRGELVVAVPPGITDGQMLRLPEAGDPRPDGTRDACFVAIHVVASPMREPLPVARVERGVVREPRAVIADRLAVAVALIALIGVLYWIAGR